MSQENKLENIQVEASTGDEYTLPGKLKGRQTEQEDGIILVISKKEKLFDLYLFANERSVQRCKNMFFIPKRLPRNQFDKVTRKAYRAYYKKLQKHKPYAYALVEGREIKLFGS